MAELRRPSRIWSASATIRSTISAAGTLDGMIGCVAADMGVTLLPRAVAERDDLTGNIRIHTLSASHARVDTVFIQRRSAHPYSALRGLAACLQKNHQVIAA